ncbi:MAG TPA: class I SAM-dependent methyltransferase [Micromonosporaceae bacterium]
MDLGLVDHLRTEQGCRTLACAEALAGSDPLRATQALRDAGIDAAIASAALTQATLRRRAAAKFGPDASRMLFTRTGLEQATRAVVADRRAARLASAGVASVADLGCGVGADTLAFARAGLRVCAVEADPVTAAIAAANVEELGHGGSVTVTCGDAAAADLSCVDAVFCDPARRDPARGRRVFDPGAFAPPWSFVSALPARVPATVLKLAPGIDHALIPDGAEAEWVSVAGDVVEAALWHGPLAVAARRATLIGTDGTAHELTGPGTVTAPVAPPRRYLYDPDGAVVRSHLVAEFASTVDGKVADPRIAYVFADTPTPTPFATVLEVLAELPYGRKALRAALRAHDIGTLEIRKRGVAVDPDELRRDLRLDGRTPAALVLTRLGTRPVAFLCQAVRA